LHSFSQLIFSFKLVLLLKELCLRLKLILNKTRGQPWVVDYLLNSNPRVGFGMAQPEEQIIGLVRERMFSDRKAMIILHFTSVRWLVFPFDEKGVFP
jgi:hypothetical protein